MTIKWNRLFHRLKAFSPNCKEAVRMQSDALDRPLSMSQRIGLRIHLFLCQWCRRYGKQIEFLHSAARQHDDNNACLPELHLGSAARDRIKKRLREEEKK